MFTILVKTHSEAARQLDLFGIAAQNGAALVIDGVSLQFCLDFHQQRFLGAIHSLQLLINYDASERRLSAHSGSTVFLCHFAQYRAQAIQISSGIREIGLHRKSKLLLLGSFI